jgi:hypothetical protein
MPRIGRVLFVESHASAWSARAEVAAEMNPVNPKDAGYVQASELARSSGFDFAVHEAGELTISALADVDVLVLPHSSIAEWEKTVGTASPLFTDVEIADIRNFVEQGGGLLILAETEQPKYGNNLASIAELFGIKVLNVTVQDPTNAHKDVATWVKPEKVRNTKFDLLANVDSVALYRAGALEAVDPRVFSVLRTSSNADPAAASLLQVVAFGEGRVAVLADSDIFGDDSIQELDNKELWINLLMWLMPGNRGQLDSSKTSIAESSAWKQLTDAVEALRPLQNADGSLNSDVASAGQAQPLVDEIKKSIQELASQFPHQKEHLEATIRDFDKWAAGGFGVPDFFDSLMLFHPDEKRVHGIENLVVFPMYTQNGNLNRNFEAVVTRTFWPEFAEKLEATKYQNPAFVPIEFVGFTKGYDTHSAVLFPETVATREVGTFTWGGIFCDREAARFRKVSSEASELLKLSLPADAELLLQNQKLAQETFVLWDLIHDRTHSHGDLPFDPFMIKQRMPFWMYALEELRCDLNTFKETSELEADGIFYGRFIRYAILFDRLFRFPITGERVRNYDGLGGQLIFAWLHKQGVLHWTDNTLSLDWPKVNASVVQLCDAVNDLYREGIDRSRIAHWMAAHEFIAAWVEPHPASKWARGIEELPIAGEPKELVDAVLGDEFPLNVFYEALRTKLAPTIAGVSGITA